MSDEDLILPDPLPALPDMAYHNQEGPYANSGLRDVCGTKINPDCRYYADRELMTSPNCGMRNCAHPQMELFLNEVGGYDPRTRIAQSSFEDFQMSAVIPRIDVRGKSLPYPLKKGTYIIDYPSINANPKKLPDAERSMSIKERFEPDTNLVLSFFGNHPVVVGLWTQTEFWYHPFLSQFDAVLIPDFAAFSNDSWPQSLQGERMHQIFAEEGTAAGVNVIPTLAGSSEASLRRQIELYVSQYPKINTIHVDCYGSGVNRTDWIWRWLYTLEKYCAPHTHIRWIISGITTGWGVRELNEMFPNKNYHLVMSISPYVSAMVGSRDPEYQALQYRKKIRQIEDFYFENVVTERATRPDKLPPEYWKMLKTPRNPIRKRINEEFNIT